MKQKPPKKEKPKFEPAPLTNDSLTGDDHRIIGRFLRATAEFEHVITTKLFLLADVDDLMGALLIGDKGMRNKTDLLSKLLKLKDPDEDKYFTAHVKPFILRLSADRRAFAHGSYAGRGKSGEIVFLAFERAENMEEIGRSTPGHGMIPADIEASSKVIETLTTDLITRWKLQPLLDKRLSRAALRKYQAGIER